MHRTHMYVHKIFKTNDTSHSSWKGGEGKGWKGSRRDGGFRGEKRDLRKEDAKIVSDFPKNVTVIFNRIIIIK